MPMCSAGFSHEDIEELLAAHALEAIDADEADAVETHLLHCERCRADMVSFRAIAAQLPARDVHAVCRSFMRRTRRTL